MPVAEATVAVAQRVAALVTAALVHILQGHLAHTVEAGAEAEAESGAERPPDGLDAIAGAFRPIVRGPGTEPILAVRVVALVPLARTVVCVVHHHLTVVLGPGLGPTREESRSVGARSAGMTRGADIARGAEGKEPLLDPHIHLSETDPLIQVLKTDLNSPELGTAHQNPSQSRYALF